MDTCPKCGYCPTCERGDTPYHTLTITPGDIVSGNTTTTHSGSPVTYTN